MVVSYALEDGTAGLVEDETTAGGASAGNPGGLAKGTGIEEPPRLYTADDGRVYELDSWEVKTVEIPAWSVPLSKEVVFNGVERMDMIPTAITIQAQGDGETASKSCPLLSWEVTREYETGDFTFPVVVRGYGSDVYMMGSQTVGAGFIPIGGEPGDPSAAGALLEDMGLDPSRYFVDDVAWDGEAYTDADGTLCRNAVATGRKMVMDIRATYGGEARLAAREMQRVEAHYRLPAPAVAAGVPAPTETMAIAAVEPPADPKVMPVTAPEVVQTARIGSRGLWETLLRRVYVVSVSLVFLVALVALVFRMLFLRRGCGRGQRHGIRRKPRGLPLHGTDHSTV
ncbi:MAG: hypothetical protein LBR77_12255 [Lachnospiraceae bacterium]|nr:hypothetical protein [Lachnospiraceae bacterium]